MTKPFYLLIHCLILATTLCSENFEVLYKRGIDLYNTKEWAECQRLISDSIKYYHSHVDTMLDCHIDCEESSADVTTFEGRSVEEKRLELNLRIIATYNCSQACKKRHHLEDVSYVALMEFDMWKPYDFLQFCAFNSGAHFMAAAAIHTYSIHHADSIGTRENLAFYRALPDITEKDFVNMEEKPYQIHFRTAVEAYNNGDWRSVVEEITRAIELYLREESRCRRLCELKQENNGVNSSVSDRQIEILKCQYACAQYLSVYKGRKVFNYFASHFHYRQFSHFKLNKIEAAMSDIATFLLFAPNDEIMLHNKQYYINSGYPQEHLTPSQESLRYSKIRKKLQEAYEMIKKLEQGRNLKLAEDALKKSDSEQEVTEMLDQLERTGVRVVDEGGGGMAALGFLRIEQCEMLAEFIRSIPEDEHGICHTAINPVLKDVTEENPEMLTLRILLGTSQIVLHYTEMYLRSDRLYISAMNLTCTSLSGERPDPDCTVQEDGSCVKDLSHHNSNQYMAVLHLSTNVEDKTVFILSDTGNNSKGAHTADHCGLVTVFPISTTPRLTYSPTTTQRCFITYTFSTDETATDPDLLSAQWSALDVEEIYAQSAVVFNRSAIITTLEKSGLDLTLESSAKRESRFVADGLLTRDVCAGIIAMTKFGMPNSGYADAQSRKESPFTDSESFSGIDIMDMIKGVTLGDGYTDQRYDIVSQTSPHTEHELFHGMTVRRMYELVKSDQMPASDLETFLAVSEASRASIQTYFNLTHLYFDFTHLVCREAIDGENLSREDLSHPVHADNCFLQPDGLCLKEKPAFIQRDYSAILYLNDVFTGGQFFFAHNNLSAQYMVLPTCGRLVAFNAAEYHGVKAVLSGRRCAVAMWFTLNPNHEEISRVQAHRLVAGVGGTVRDISGDGETRGADGGRDSGVVNNVETQSGKVDGGKGPGEGEDAGVDVDNENDLSTKDVTRDKGEL